MTPRTVVALACGTALAACTSQMPTAAAPGTAEKFIISNRWLRTNVPFVPVGINDSGVIVGSTNNQAVRYYAGTTTVLAPPPSLPISVFAGKSAVPAIGIRFTPAYSAIGIANTGHILGRINGGSPLLWTSPTATPQIISADGVALYASAINDNDMIVGATDGTPFRWTPSGGLQMLASPFGYQAIAATYVSNTGYVAGYAEPLLAGSPEGLVRWDPNGVPTMLLPLSNDLPDNRPGGIDPAGDILATSGGTAIVWTVEGQVIPVSGAPSETLTEGWSSLGRVVGYMLGSDQPWTMFKGVLTWLPQPTPADQADIPVGVNTCGTIVARRVNNNAVIDSGFVWSHSLTCDGSTILASRAR